MTNNVIVTDSVFKRIHFLAEKAKDEDLKLRISVSGGGCSGFIYDYKMVKEMKPDDIVISMENSSLLIDPDSMGFLESCTIDFIEELGSSYFSIKNPNATAKCGCGNSFAV